MQGPEETDSKEAGVALSYLGFSILLDHGPCSLSHFIPHQLCWSCRTHSDCCHSVSGPFLGMSAGKASEEKGWGALNKVVGRAASGSGAWTPASWEGRLSWTALPLHLCKYSVL